MRNGLIDLSKVGRDEELFRSGEEEIRFSKNCDFL